MAISSAAPGVGIPDAELDLLEKVAGWWTSLEAAVELKSELSKVRNGSLHSRQGSLYQSRMVGARDGWEMHGSLSETACQWAYRSKFPRQRPVVPCFAS